MRNTRSLALIAVLVIAAGAPFTHAQTPAPSGEPGTAVVSIYRVAPGKHLDFLKWQAAREAIDKAAGVAPTQWYVHTDGDSWDYVSIGPETTKEQDDKVEAMMKQKGLKTGLAGGLEFRQYVSSHTDTFARGPMTAAQIVAMAEK